MMRRFGIVICILLGVLLVAGCGSGDEPEVPEAEPVVVEPEERLPLILDAAVPERNPFGETRRSTDWEKEQARVDNDTRDPFVVAGSDSDWSGDTGNVSRSGRDPFDPTGQGVVEPEPVEPEEPEELEEPVGPLPDAVTVQVRTLDRCWLDVFVDDVRVLRTNVPRGETLEWTGSVVLLEQVGRDYAVHLVVNGKDYGLLQNFVPGFTDGVFVDRDAGIRMTLEERFEGGVLVGLRIRLLGSD